MTMTQQSIRKRREGLRQHDHMIMICSHRRRESFAGCRLEEVMAETQHNNQLTTDGAFIMSNERFIAVFCGATISRGLG